MGSNDHIRTTRRAMLAGLGAALVPACRRDWSPPEVDPTSRSQIKPYVPGAEDFATYEERWIASSCAQCASACGTRVRVVEGRAVRIEGNREHPANRGALCATGLSELQTVYDPDRVAGPMRRVAGRLVPTSWDDAIATLVAALARSRATPERVLAISGDERGFTHDLLARLCSAYGTPNFVAASHGATLSRAMELATGVRALPAYDATGAGATISLESSVFEHGIRFSQIAAAMRRDSSRRGRLIHAGPMFDLSAYNADRWLRIRPGTSGALALGICHALLRDGTYDREVDVAALAADWPADRVAAITGCDASLVGELARELWNRRPVLVVVDERSLAFTNGLETAGAALALAALLGSLERGGGLRIAPEAPLASWPAFTHDDVAQRGLASPRLDGAGHAPYAAATSVLDALPEAIAATPPAIALLHRANPVYARAQPKRWRDALAKVPLVVSFSPFVDETVDAVAHLVLPDHTDLERLDDATPSPDLPRAFAGVRRPAVAPLHDTRATADVIVEIAHRLAGSIAAAFPWRTARDALEERWLGLHTASRGTIVAASPRAFLDQLYAAGFWADTADAPPRALQVSAAATWREPRWDGDPAQFPLALLAYRPLGDGGPNQPWLRTLRARPGVEDWTFAVSISPHDAPGIATGDRIRVTSPYGSLVATAHVDSRLAPGCVAIPTGGGHDAFGRWARGFGANVMELLAPAPAAETGASLACTTRVRMEVV